jgi:WD40 repeat protein
MSRPSRPSLLFLALLATAPLRAGEPVRVDCYGDPLPPRALARLGSTRMLDCIVSPDGKTLVSARGGRIVISELPKGREVRSIPLDDDRDSPGPCAISADGRLLAAGSTYTKHDVRLWDAASGKLLHKLEGAGSATNVLAFSPDGKILAAAVFEKVHLWDTSTGNLLGTLRPSDQRCQAIAFSADGRGLASADGRVVRLWDVRARKELSRWDAHADDVSSLSFSPDGKTLASGGWDRAARLWDPDTGKELHCFKGHRGAVLSVAFSPDGKQFASLGGDGDYTAYLWDPATGRPLRRLSGGNGWVSRLAFSADGTLLAVAGAKVLVWDITAGKERDPRSGHKDTVCSLALSPDRKTLATRSIDRTVRLWDLGTGRETRQVGLSERCGGSVAFSPDGRTLAWQDETELCFADARTGERLAKQTMGQLGLGTFAFSPDGGRVAVGHKDDKVRLWDRADGKAVATFGGHKDMINAVAFSPDGKTLASASGTTPNHDSSARLWDVAGGKERHRLKGHSEFVTSVAFSPDGQHVVTGSSDGTVRLWSAVTGKERRCFSVRQGQIFAVAFSPDGRTVAAGSGGWDCCAYVWELASGKERCRFAGHKDGVRAIAFAPDGRTLLSGGADTTVLIWDLLAPDPSSPPAGDLTRKGFDRLWDSLGDLDATRANTALCALLGSPQQAIPLLADRLRPVRAASPERLSRLVAELDNDEFDVRERATVELAGLEEMAVPELQDALRNRPAPEARRRLGRLIERLSADQDAPSPEALRALRAIEALERVGDLDARRLLSRLAAGDSEARRTREAKGALERLAKRAGSAP